MFLRTLIALGMLGLAGCVTTPDYRYANDGGGYYYGDSGYYANDGYYGGGGYYAAGNRAYLGAGSSRYGYPGWGMGFSGYGAYGIMPGWNSYWDAGWGGSYWGGYGFSPFYYGSSPWYNTYYYYPPRDPNRRDMSAVRAEQVRQAQYQRGDAGIRQQSEGIRMWAPARADARSEAAQRAALQQRQPMRSTPYQRPAQNRDTRPTAAPQPRYETMPRGMPGANRTEGRQVQPASTPTRNFQSAPRGTPQPRSAPSPQPRAMPSVPARSVPRAAPISEPVSSRSRGHGRIAHHDSRGR